jgi:hypothetical protein
MKINECYLSHLRAKDVKRIRRKNDLKDLALAGVVFFLYCVVSNMGYNDCINLGVC